MVDNIVSSTLRQPQAGGFRRETARERRRGSRALGGLEEDRLPDRQRPRAPSLEPGAVAPAEVDFLDRALHGARRTEAQREARVTSRPRRLVRIPRTAPIV